MTINNLNFSDIISIIGIIISLVVAIYVHHKTEKYNETLLKKDYFDRIFFTILFDEFPKNISELDMNGNKFSTTNLDILNCSVKILREKILFFKYYESSEKFYNNVYQVLDNLQNKIFEMYGFDTSNFRQEEINQKIKKKKDELSKEYKKLCEILLDYIYKNKQ